LTDFFLCLGWDDFGSEDLGTEKMVLAAAVNRSNGV